MNVFERHPEVWNGLLNGFKAGRLAHAYVIVGAPRGNALEFTEGFLQLLFCSSEEKPCGICPSCRNVAGHKHVDTLWIEPQSKSRMIRVDDVEGLIHRVSQTAFEGGWKAGVILSADRMNTQSENKLLKTLEEPPQNTMLLLVTDSPQALLPTILSRCQRITLSGGDVTEEAWQAGLMEQLADLPPANGLDAARSASRLKGLFDLLKSGISDAEMEALDQEDEALDESKLKQIMEARINARLKEVQSEVFCVMLDWHRDVLMLSSGLEDAELIFPERRTVLQEQADLHTQGSALRAVKVIEQMAQRLDRNIPDLQIFDEAFRKLTV